MTNRGQIDAGPVNLVPLLIVVGLVVITGVQVFEEFPDNKEEWEAEACASYGDNWSAIHDGDDKIDCRASNGTDVTVGGFNITSVPS